MSSSRATIWLAVATLAGGVVPALHPQSAPGFDRRFPEGRSTLAVALPAGLTGARAKQFSLELELRAGVLRDSRVDGAGAGPVTLLSIGRTAGAGQGGGAGQPAVVAEIVPLAEQGGGTKVQFVVRTDFRPQALVVGIPTKLLEAGQAHRLLLRYLGFRLEFFVDGVLADEEWPMGRIALAGTEGRVAQGAVRRVRMWEGALPDAEIKRMNGGDEAIARRADKFFGPETSQLQYWRPRGYNTSAGDPMPFFHDGTLHLFYLLDRRHHKSKWGLGAHQWGHVSTTDLVHWKSYPAALTITEEEEGSICTGSVFFEGGMYYAFYAKRMPDRTEHLELAVSEDGIAFAKTAPSPFAGPAAPYRRGPNRDPFVFGEPGDFHMLVTASLEDAVAGERAGALEHLTSRDLREWKVETTPFLVPGYAADPECSDLFLWRGWYYLLFSEGGVAHYRMSRSALGPWSQPKVDRIDGAEARVMKTGAFTGDRRIGVAFLADGDFGGQLIFRELLQAADGTLEASFPKEMTPHGRRVPFHVSGRTGEVGQAGGVVSLRAGAAGLAGLGSAGGSLAEVDAVPQDFVLRTTVMPGVGTAAFSFVLSAGEAGARESTSTLKISPGAGRVEWLGEGGASALESGSGKGTSLEGVKDLQGAIRVEIVALGGVIDVSLNGRHTLVHRLPKAGKRELAIGVEAGSLTVSEVSFEALGGGEDK